jgi:hypothetical protein
MGEVGASKRDGEKETQCRGLGVHLRRLCAGGDLIGLEAPQIVARNRLRLTAEKVRQRLDMADIVILRLVTEVAIRHVLQHAAAQFADGFSTRGSAIGVSCHEFGVLDPSILKTGRQSVIGESSVG